MTYPNVLVLDYIKSTNQATPEIQMEAEQFIAQGYQRLLTFEVPGGGFSLFGQAPAQLMLTAYGLMEFSDMARVSYVDPALLERTAGWLMRQQAADGSWRPEGLTIESGWENLLRSELPATAYVTWALLEAGYEDTAEVQRGLSYVREFLKLEDDSYALALIANALAGGDPEGERTRQVLAELESRKVVEDGKVYWTTEIASFMGGRDNAASLETTALVAYAMLKAGVYPETASGALDYLTAQKDSFGTWQTTQATILSLKAMLLAATRGGEGQGEATVRVSLNGEEADPVRITEANADVVHLVSFSDKARLGENAVRIEVEGQRALMYQVITEYYLPWDQVPKLPAEQEAVEIEVAYDRTELAVNDVVTVRARVALKLPGVARMAVVDLGLPPGFAVLDEDLALLVEEGVISRYEVAARQIIIYLEDFSSKEPLEFAYRLRAKYPLKAKSPASLAYDYYTPERQGDQRPTEIVVNE
ncbi:MAG: hypothetical protein GXY76_04450 [Chloroflexi bacterium]|nr:hypothetical protein [Chloroflexota bacterium]